MREVPIQHGEVAAGGIASSRIEQNGPVAEEGVGPPVLDLLHSRVIAVDRIDFRLDANQGIYALEANPNPEIAYGEELAESAEKAGLSYEGLLQQILSLGLHWRRDVYA